MKGQQQDKYQAVSYQGSAIALPRSGWLSFAQRLLLLWESPLWSGALALVIYTLFTALHRSPVSNSGVAFYNYLADAFLHGRLDLRVIPPFPRDLVFFHNHYYLYWPPFPAVLLMPLVAIFGVGLSDVAFTLVLGASNVALAAWLFRLLDARGVILIRPSYRAALVLFLAFGTVHFILAISGRVWFTGQLVGFLCVLLAYVFALAFRGWKAFLLSGIAIACAAATRNNMVFTGIWPLYYLASQNWPATGAGKAAWARLAGRVLLFGGPVAAAVALLAIYNFARFGSFTDVGLSYHIMNPVFANDFHAYGAFSLHYVPINFYYQYIYYPLPINDNTTMGGSLFLMSPLFFGAFFAFRGAWKEKLPALLLLGSILLVSIPILLLMGTGWRQYGPRYTLDFTVPLLLLTAAGMKKWPPAVVAFFTLISIISYTIGAVTILPGIG